MSRDSLQLLPDELPLRVSKQRYQPPPQTSRGIVGASFRFQELLRGEQERHDRESTQSPRLLSSPSFAGSTTSSLPSSGSSTGTTSPVTPQSPGPNHFQAPPLPKSFSLWSKQPTDAKSSAPISHNFVRRRVKGIPITLEREQSHRDPLAPNTNLAKGGEQKQPEQQHVRMLWSVPEASAVSVTPPKAFRAQGLRRCMRETTCIK